MCVLALLLPPAALQEMAVLGCCLPKCVLSLQRLAQ